MGQVVGTETERRCAAVREFASGWAFRRSAVRIFGEAGGSGREPDSRNLGSCVTGASGLVGQWASLANGHRRKEVDLGCGGSPSCFGRMVLPTRRCVSEIRCCLWLCSALATGNACHRGACGLGAGGGRSRCAAGTVEEKPFPESSLRMPRPEPSDTRPQHVLPGAPTTLPSAERNCVRRGYAPNAKSDTGK